MVTVEELPTSSSSEESSEEELEDVPVTSRRARPDPKPAEASSAPEPEPALIFVDKSNVELIGFDEKVVKVMRKLRKWTYRADCRIEGDGRPIPTFVVTKLPSMFHVAGTALVLLAIMGGFVWYIRRLPIDQKIGWIAFAFLCYFIPSIVIRLSGFIASGFSPKELSELLFIIQKMTALELDPERSNGRKFLFKRGTGRTIYDTDEGDKKRD